jgi:hypothetical protein
MEMGKERIESEESELLMDAFYSLGISRRNSVSNNRFLFKLRSNKVVRDEQPLEGSSVTWMAQQEVRVT